MNPGDLGRRVRERREELGLDLADVARLAGIDVGFLAYLEEEAPTGITSPTLFALARALGTTASLLVGGGTQQPPRRWGPGGHSYLEPIEERECLAILAHGGVGHVTFVSDRGPVALPVNFALLARDVVLRTHAATSIARAVRSGADDGCPMGFAADHVDYPMDEGWSVLVTGVAHEVVDERERTKVDALDLDPWTGDGRQFHVRIVTAEVTGRRIRVLRQPES